MIMLARNYTNWYYMVAFSQTTGINLFMYLLISYSTELPCCPTSQIMWRHCTICINYKVIKCDLRRGTKVAPQFMLEQTQQQGSQWDAQRYPAAMEEGRFVTGSLAVRPHATLAPNTCYLCSISGSCWRCCAVRYTSDVTQQRSS